MDVIKGWSKDVTWSFTFLWPADGCSASQLDAASINSSWVDFYPRPLQYCSIFNSLPYIAFFFKVHIFYLGKNLNSKLPFRFMVVSKYVFIWLRSCQPHILKIWMRGGWTTSQYIQPLCSYYLSSYFLYKDKILWTWAGRPNYKSSFSPMASILYLHITKT